MFLLLRKTNSSILLLLLLMFLMWRQLDICMQENEFGHATSHHTPNLSLNGSKVHVIVRNRELLEENRSHGLSSPFSYHLLESFFHCSLYHFKGLHLCLAGMNGGK